MPKLEQFRAEINGETFDLVLPGNGRIKLIGLGCGEFAVWFVDPAGLPHEVYCSDTTHGRRVPFDPRWFPDACDNAAEWHMEQANEVDWDDGESDLIAAEVTEKYYRAKAWRAAKRAHIAAKGATQ